MICAWFGMMSRIPFTGLRLRMCRWHADGCPRCRQAGESGEAPLWLIRTGHLPPGLDLWPGVMRRISGLPSAAASLEVSLPQGRQSWRWAFAAAMLLMAFFAGFLAFFLGRGMHPHPGPAEQRPVARTRLCSAKIGDQLGRVFQVQSRNPDRSIFWIAKDNPRS